MSSEVKPLEAQVVSESAYAFSVPPVIREKSVRNRFHYDQHTGYKHITFSPSQLISHQACRPGAVTRVYIGELSAR